MPLAMPIVLVALPTIAIRTKASRLKKSVSQTASNPASSARRAYSRRAAMGSRTRTIDFRIIRARLCGLQPASYAIGRTEDEKLIARSGGGELGRQQRHHGGNA